MSGMIGDEGAFRRRRSGKVEEVMHPLGESVALPRRKPPPPPPPHCDGNHDSLWDAIHQVREAVADLGGKMTVLLTLAGGTFVVLLAAIIGIALQ